jgi:mono/diheme cytochrome c family protein
MRMFLIAATLASAFFGLLPVANAQDAAQIERGKYVATAGDCAACHGTNFAGGTAVTSPIGKIFASNITFDAATGIGGWTEAQFADALRRGRSPGKGWLFPAMPYTSYTGLSDADVSALYAYLKSVKPVDNKVPATDLGFPFIRPAMMGWNILNLSPGVPVGAAKVSDEAEQRGLYLVETLGHCSTCHTPRGALMGEQNNLHLSGALVGGWYAPNITPDSSGIGGWSDEQLAQFLKTGHNAMAVAGGDMGLAVERSLSRLPDGDIADIIAYLQKVPTVATTPLAAAAAAPQISPDVVEDSVSGWQALAARDTTNGATLFNGACASCHGVSGTGGAGPDLTVNTGVRTIEANNLVQVIAQGNDRKAGGAHYFMPGFSDQMSPVQIASLATYVRKTVAQTSFEPVTAQQVQSMLAGEVPAGWLIRNAVLLAWSGLALVAPVLLFVLFLIFRRRPALTA